jgi:hypothetical protein
VAERLASGRVNRTPEAPARTFGQIVRAKAFTPVKGIIGVMLVLVLIASPGPNALFAGCHHHQQLHRDRPNPGPSMQAP